MGEVRQICDNQPMIVSIPYFLVSRAVHQCRPVYLFMVCIQCGNYSKIFNTRTDSMALQREIRERDDIFFIKTLFKRKAEVTDAEVDYFKKNPEQIETITAPHTVHLLILFGGLILGITMVILSKFFGIWEVFSSIHPLARQTLIDITFEIGVALIGGGVTAYFLGVLLNQQQENAVKWKSEIYHRIKITDENAQNSKESDRVV